MRAVGACKARDSGVVHSCPRAQHGTGPRASLQKHRETNVRNGRRSATVSTEAHFPQRPRQTPAQDRAGRRELRVLAALGKWSLQSRFQPRGEKERHLLCLRGKGEVRKEGHLP